MLHRLILKVTKFQLPPQKRFGTVVKNILGGPSWPPCQIGLKEWLQAFFYLNERECVRRKGFMPNNLNQSGMFDQLCLTLFSRGGGIMPPIGFSYAVSKRLALGK